MTGIVPDGADSHTFEPVPTDVKILGAADIIIVNGLDLELPTVKLAEKVKRAKTPIVRLGNHALRKEDWRYDFSFPREHGHPNPHLWPNIALAMRYAEITRDNLIALDPQHKEGYIANTAAYLAKLGVLDEAIFNCVKTIPEKNRKLVTYHDSFAYFAPRYGMKVIAAIQPPVFPSRAARSHSYHQADKKGKGACHFRFRGFSQQGGGTNCAGNRREIHRSAFGRRIAPSAP